MSNSQEEMINKIMEGCNEKINEYNSIIKDCEDTIKMCKNIISFTIDPKVIKKVKYNAIIAKNALENSDVADPNDRVAAENNISECNVSLMESKTNFAKFAKDIEDIKSDVLKGDVNILKGIIERNAKSCQYAVDYADSVIKGEFSKEKEQKFYMAMRTDERDYNSVSESIDDKVVSEEDYTPDIDFSALGEAVDEEVNMPQNIDEINLDVSEEIDDNNEMPLESTVVDTIDSTSLFTESAPLEEEEEKPLSFEETDSELDKVVYIEDIGAQELEEEQEEVKSRGRKAA